MFNMFSKKVELLDCFVYSEKGDNYDHMSLITHLTEILNGKNSDERCKITLIACDNYDFSNGTDNLIVHMKVDRNTLEEIKELKKVLAISEVVA